MIFKHFYGCLYFCEARVSRCREINKRCQGPILLQLQFVYPVDDPMAEVEEGDGPPEGPLVGEGEAQLEVEALRVPVRVRREQDHPGGSRLDTTLVPNGSLTYLLKPALLADAMATSHSLVPMPRQRYSVFTLRGM